MLNGLYIGCIDKRHEGMRWYYEVPHRILQFFSNYPTYRFIDERAFAKTLSLNAVKEIFPVLVRKMIQSHNILTLFIYDEQADMYFTLDENNNLIRRCKPNLRY